MIQHEENIMRILNKFDISFMPEKSEWNPIGVTEEEAMSIAQRHNLNLKTISHPLLPSLRVFQFKKYLSVPLNGIGEDGGGD